MGVRSWQYGREIDKEGKSLSATHKRAVHKSSMATKPNKFNRPSTGDRLILALLKALKSKKKVKHGKVSKTNSR